MEGSGPKKPPYKSLLIVNNQHWAGDKLAVFARAILKECLCSTMLIAG